MKVQLFCILFFLFSIGVCKAELPAWFLKSFNDHQLNTRYKIIAAKPDFLEADFNGDGKNDIAVQIIEIKTKKKGVLIINAGSSDYFLFGAGTKSKSDDSENTNWVNGWKIYRNKYAYKTLTNADGDLMGSKKILLKYPAIYLYALEDGAEEGGLVFYWDGKKYSFIHQGD